MGAVRTKMLADIRQRRLQFVAITAVLFLASAASTLAMTVLVESNAPFDRAFASANGAHLVVDYDGGVPADRLAATRLVSPVTAAAGPWPVVNGVLGHPKGGLVFGGSFAGRPHPDPSIDSVTIQDGRWWQAPGEAVLDQDTARLLDKRVGDAVALYAEPDAKSPKGPGNPDGGPAAAAHVVTVVGIAGSVSTPDVAVWTSPTDIAALVPAGVPMAQEMLYRVSPSATASDLATALASITGGLPSNAVVSSQTYLDIKAGVDSLADLYVPILLAFSIFALLAAAFTIANIVSGIVLTSYRDIGVLKAIGFTPGQVTGILVGQILLPVALGTTLGVLVGVVASQPVVQQSAMSFGLPALFTLSLPVVGAVIAIAIAVAITASIGPAIRAGRLSAVAAMTRGSAPAAGPDGGRLRRLGLRLPVNLPLRLGISSGVAHPVRATMTLGALVVGVAAVTFAIGLNWSLLRVMDDLNRDQASPVRAELRGSGMTPVEVTSAFRTNPGTGRFVAIGETQVTVPRAGSIPFVGYAADVAWLGYALIEGRWFEASGEAVAPTNFYTETGLQVGDSATVVRDGRSVTVRLVGEIFDTDVGDGDNLVLRGTWADVATLEPGIEPSRWEARPTDGVEARTYRNDLQTALGGAVDLYMLGDKWEDASFLLFLAVVGLMGVVLVVMSLGGVFNTVLLETRQRTREIAVLKAVGLAPVQVTAMVLGSIVPVGLLAGLIGVPIGLLAQHVVLDYMGQVAAKTAIPASVFDVFPPAMFVGLILSGLAIGSIAAFLPAQRAARARIAPVLQAE